MKKIRSLSVNLKTLLSLMAILLIGVISVFTSIIIYTDYKFNEESMARSEKILVNGLLTGSMPLAVATRDKELIKTLVQGHLGFDEIYAISVISDEGELLYRAEKETKEEVNIFSKTYNLVSASQDLDIDNFNDQEASDQMDQIPLGTVTIYFSTATLQDKVKKQRLLAISLVAIAIFVCTILILMFNRIFSLQVKQITQLTETIKTGQRLQERDKPLIVKELDTIDTYLYTMANTIYDRDKELTLALNKALDAEEFQDEFIRAISHDIKTPLGVVVSLLDIINDEIKVKDLDPALIQKISACYKSATILADVTEELFNLEQFQSQELINRKTDTNLSELFQKLSALYEQKFIDKNLIFKVQNNNVRTDDLPSNILVDEKKLILTLENIIDNALKFTNDGFVSIYWRIQNHNLCVTVRDSGIGIPDDKVQSIFEKHRQLGDQKTNRYSGRGLGLFYVNRLLEVMQGKCSVESKIGLGTAFEICVPFDPVSSTLFVPTTKQRETLNTLIIDDSEETCFALTSMLEKLGVHSTHECIPEIGYNRLIMETPDLVFIDFHMPNLSGDEIANKARKMLLPHATFFVCITAEPKLEILRELEKIFDVVIQKPLKKERIEEVVKFARNSKTVATRFLVEHK